MAAFLIDAFMLVFALVIPTSILSWGAIAAGGSPTAVAAIWWGALGIFLAGILLRDGWRGRSPGKYLLGLRIDTANGLPCSRVKSVVRNLPLIVPVWNLLEVYLVIFARNSRRTGDRIARTSVVEE